MKKVECTMSKNEIETYCPKSRTEWRNWLKKNHQLKSSIWLVYYKSSTKESSISWSEAVDEALCFGWIDSTKKTIDEERYMQYFSKRKPKSIWSKINKDKVDNLISKKLMQEAGNQSVAIAKKNNSWTIMDEVEALIIPEDLIKEFGTREGALEYFQSLSKSAKKNLLSWIVLAKKPETKQKRILDIAENASRNRMPDQFK